MATCSDNHIDCVDYNLFPKIVNWNNISNDKLNEKLCKILEEIYVDLSPLLVDYIWQNEQFRLSPATQKDDSPPFIHGSTQFGDNIEDEWFIVYMLLLLTKNYDGLLATVSDTDGEFLLIEAAKSLPKWLNPETSTNRVFLFQGELHIIPLPTTPAELAWLPPGTPTVHQAVNIIRSHPDRTLASKPIRDAVHKRLESYPAKIRDNIHRTRCYLPANAARVLQHCPSLVAAAVQAFCHRDPIDMKACRYMKRFPPKDLIMSQVKFTRCLYAEILNHSFQPPTRSEWKIPPSSNPKHKSHDLGMKLSYGLEILCSRCRNPPAMSSTKTENMEDRIWNSSLWQRYLQSLKLKGYFCGEIEGSTLYTKLLDSAKKFYMETMNEATRDVSDPGYKVLEILDKVPENLDEMLQIEKDLPEDDDERWLTLTEEELDKMIEIASGRPVRNPVAMLPEEETEKAELNFDPGLLTDTMKSFVEKVSSFEGAEFPKSSESAPISFDADSFGDVIKNLLEYRPPPEEEDESDDFLSSDDDSDENAIPCTDSEPYNNTAGTEVKQIQEIMKAMDEELGATTIGESFERQSEGASVEDEKEDLRPVEVDMNLLKNLLESYSSQNGLAGPASNILHSMGIKLPENAD
ncbi:protein ecdysoneless homolog [Antedon mediterranea]|uniref:protein ecdysoneless homolog n=1 Tax=Antedon mediterranea TaxID=105859 RepID=UPI003AF641C7